MMAALNMSIETTPYVTYGPYRNELLHKNITTSAAHIFLDAHFSVVSVLIIMSNFYTAFYEIEKFS